MKILSRHKEIFSGIPGKTNIIEHKIELTENNPVSISVLSLAVRHAGIS